MSAQDTPRTDALIARHEQETADLRGAMPLSADWGAHAIRQVSEVLDHARTLERELSALRSEAGRDGARYRWLRQQHWTADGLCVVEHGKQDIRLGAYCPSGELLDEAIDAAMLAASERKGE